MKGFFCASCRAIIVIALFLAVSVSAAYGQKGGVFATRIPGESVRSLEQAAADFRVKGMGPSVGIEIPTRTGSKHLQLVPHDIRSENYRAVISGNDGRREDHFEVDLFRGKDAARDDISFRALLYLEIQ